MNQKSFKKVLAVLFLGAFSMYNIDNVLAENIQKADYIQIMEYPSGAKMTVVGGTVQVEHAASIEEGGLELCSGEHVKFKHDPKLSYIGSGGNMDTPFGTWCNNTNSWCLSSGIDKQLGFSTSPGATGAIGGGSVPGFVHWTGVKPTMTITSGDENILTCDSNTNICTAKENKTGTVTVTATMSATKARIWSVVGASIFSHIHGTYAPICGYTNGNILGVSRVLGNYCLYSATLDNVYPGGGHISTGGTEYLQVNGSNAAVDNSNKQVVVFPQTTHTWEVTVNTAGECACGNANYAFETFDLNWANHPSQLQAPIDDNDFCLGGYEVSSSVPSLVNGLPPFPAPGDNTSAVGTTTWKCSDSTSGTHGSEIDCKATNTANICGTAAKTFTIYEAPSDWSCSHPSNYFCKPPSSVTSSIPDDLTVCSNPPPDGMKGYSISQIPPFPIPGGETSWTCDDVAGNEHTCNAKNDAPMPSCPSMPNRIFNTEADLINYYLNLNLGSGATLADLDAGQRIQLDKDMCGDYGVIDSSTFFQSNDIYWEWQCKLKSGTTLPLSVNSEDLFKTCQVNNCLATTTFNEQLYVQFKEDGSVDPAEIYIATECPDLCCTYTNLSNESDPIDVGLCDADGLKSGEMVIDGHPDDIRKVCSGGPNNEDDCDNWCPDGKDPDHDCPADCEKNVTIQCVCTASKCTAQGTCAATPVFASSIADANCTNECTIGNDSTCGGGGNIIEGR